MLRILRLFFHAYDPAPTAAAAAMDALQILPRGRIRLWSGQMPVIRRHTWLQILCIRPRPFNIPKALALNLTDGQNLLSSVPCSMVSFLPSLYLFLFLYFFFSLSVSCWLCDRLSAYLLLFLLVSYSFSVLLPSSVSSSLCLSISAFLIFLRSEQTM